MKREVGKTWRIISRNYAKIRGIKDRAKTIFKDGKEKEEVRPPRKSWLSDNDSRKYRCKKKVLSFFTTPRGPLIMRIPSAGHNHLSIYQRSNQIDWTI